MTNYRCGATANFNLQSNAESDEQIIELANSLSLQRWNEQMDSLDLGDSMGVFIRAAMEDLYSGELDSVFMGNGFWVQISLDFDLFSWQKP